MDRYFNPRSPRGLRHKPHVQIIITANISIHAAQEGCDCLLVHHVGTARHFNPRSPRGLRHRLLIFADDGNQFQSTQPKRAATALFFLHNLSCFDFNPRSPRGLRRSPATATALSRNFNPRSPRGLRQRRFGCIKRGLRFQSTQPKRAATVRHGPASADVSGFQSTQPKRAATSFKKL